MVLIYLWFVLTKPSLGSVHASWHWPANAHVWDEFMQPLRRCSAAGRDGERALILLCAVQCNHISAKILRWRGLSHWVETIKIKVSKERQSWSLIHKLTGTRLYLFELVIWWAMGKGQKKGRCKLAGDPICASGRFWEGLGSEHLSPLCYTQLSVSLSSASVHRHLSIDNTHL